LKTHADPVISFSSNKINICHANHCSLADVKHLIERDLVEARSLLGRYPCEESSSAPKETAVKGELLHPPTICNYLIS
jgi:hypothetical protein